MPLPDCTLNTSDVAPTNPVGVKVNSMSPVLPVRARSVKDATPFLSVVAVPPVTTTSARFAETATSIPAINLGLFASSVSCTWG